MKVIARNPSRSRPVVIHDDRGVPHSIAPGASSVPMDFAQKRRPRHAGLVEFVPADRSAGRQAAPAPIVPPQPSAADVAAAAERQARWEKVVTIVEGASDKTAADLKALTVEAGLFTAETVPHTKAAILDALGKMRDEIEQAAQG